MTSSNTKKNDEEKSSGLLETLKSIGSSVASAIGFPSRSQDEDTTDMDVDSMGPVIEDGEEISEAVFSSLLENCPDDEIVVRSV